MINSGTLLILKDLITKEEYHNQKYGIFMFGTLTSHSYRHLLLKNQEETSLIDMRLPLGDVLIKLLEFFRKNQCYMKEDMLLYIEKVINLYAFNEKSNAWQIETN